MTASYSRGELFRWTGWFALANSAVFGLVSLRYFGGGLPIDGILSLIYLVSVYIGHHVILTTAPLFMLAAPVILIFPRQRVLTVLAVLLFAVMIALMVLDSLLWSQSRFHLNALTMKILGWQSWVFVGVIFLVGLFFESVLARAVWNWLAKPKRSYGGAVGTFCGLMIIISQGIHAWADAAYYVPVTSLGQQLPVYKGFTAKSLMIKWGLVDVKEARERELARRMSKSLDASTDRLLNYPTNPMQCSQDQPLNLMLVVVDAMRGSALTGELAPNISRFASTQGMTFRNHFSSGNSSRMGMFGLFYGLPPGYQSSFASLQKPPVLMDQLQSHDYQLGLFTSSTMVRPVSLDRTAFANVPDLRIRTEPISDQGWKRDRTMTLEWFEWLDERDVDRPFFGFLFYDAAVTKSFPPDFPHQSLPDGDSHQAERFANYQTAVRFDDELVGRVIEDLRQRGLLERTVVLITSDHGEEFGDGDGGLQRHGSGYTRHQLVSPLVLYWPGKEKGAIYQHRTSHYDIVPTLMRGLLGCSNPVTDYSVGNNLFEMQEWSWMISGSYFNYAVLEPDQITITFPNGLYEVRDWDYQLSDQPQFRGDVLEAASEQNARFYAQ